jgi:hypothetical protein
MDDDPLEHLERMASMFRAPTGPAAYLAGASGTLTPDMLSRALDELWHPRYPQPPGGYRGVRYPYGSITIPLGRPPAPEWTVEAGGYRLVIKDGAMVGLEWKL